MALAENVKKGGPYTKKERGERRREAYRLHFEYGYSINKISELMKINRNTIGNDIEYWYSKIAEHSTVFYPESIIVVTTERLDLQRTRLREYLDKISDIQEKLTIERLICDIDYKLTAIHQKIAESTRKLDERKTNYLNKHLEFTNNRGRYLTLGDKIGVSKEAREKIDKIIEEDKKNLWQRPC